MSSLDRCRRILASTWLLYLSLYLNRRNVSAIITPLTCEFGLTYGEAALTITVFFIAYAATQLPSGILTDRLGGRLVASISGWLSGLFGFLSGLAYDYTWLLVFRLLSGVAQGLGWSAVSKLVAEASAERRGAALGILSSSIPIGSFLALTLSGFLASLYGWRTAFTAPSIVLLAAASILWFTVDEESSGRLTVDLRKTIWDKDTLTVGFSYLLWKYGFEGLTYWLPTILSETLNLKVDEAGLTAGVIMLTGFVAMPLGGWISDRIGRTSTINLSLASSASLLGLTLVYGRGLTLPLLLGAASFTFTLSEGIYFAIPADNLDRSRVGAAIGLINTEGQVGSLIASWAGGAVADILGSFYPSILSFGLSSAAAALTLTLGKPYRGRAGVSSENSSKPTYER